MIRRRRKRFIVPVLIATFVALVALIRPAEAQYRLQIIASGIGIQDSAGHVSAGHAFMIIAVPTRTGIKEDAFGFYPKKDGLGIFVGTPGALNSEWRKNPERLAHAAVSLDIPIDGAERRNIYDTMSKFNVSKFQITNSNCIDFVSDVAKAVGLPSVSRSSTQTPAVYVAKLKQAYDQRVADDQQRQAAENAERAREAADRAARQQAQASMTPAGPVNTPPDIGGYCRRHGFVTAVNIDNTGYGWRCSPGNIPISALQMCSEQFGANAQGLLTTPPPGRPNDWICRH